MKKDKIVMCEIDDTVELSVRAKVTHYERGRLLTMGYAPNEVSIEIAEVEALYVLAQEDRCNDIFAVAQVAFKF